MLSESSAGGNSRARRSARLSGRHSSSSNPLKEIAAKPFWLAPRAWQYPQSLSVSRFRSLFGEVVPMTRRLVSVSLRIVIVALLGLFSGSKNGRADTIETPTGVIASSQYVSGSDARTAAHTIDSSGLDPSYATDANVSADPASGTYVGNWLCNSSPSPGTPGAQPSDGMWLANFTPTGIITFDLGSVQTLNGIWVWNYAERDPGDLSDRGAKGVSVYAASNLNAAAPSAGDTFAQSFTFLRQAGGLPAGTTTETYQWSPEYYQFTTPLTAEYIKLDITSDYGDPNFVGLAEVRFQAAAAGPTAWTGGASTTNWADAGNWSGAVPGATSGTTDTDTATFNQAAAFSPLTIDSGRNVENILFDTASVSSFTIGATGGNALVLTAGGSIQTTLTVANPQVVNAPLVLAGNYSFLSGSTTSSATLTFGGGITPAATSGVTTLTLAGTNTGANTISGVLADNGAGQLALSAQGGNWVLAGANTFSGATTVSGGTLQVGNGVSGSLSSATPISVTGGTLILAAGGSIGNTSISVTGSGTFAPQPGSGTVAAGTTGAGSGGATLSLASGTTFSMVDGAIGAFNLQQQSGFGAANTALTLNGAGLNFDISNAGADKLVVNVGSASVSGVNTIALTAIGSSLTVGGNYPLISAPAGGLGGATFQFAGGTQTTYVVAGGNAYLLTLNNSNTVESVAVTAYPKGTIVTPTGVVASSQYVSGSDARTAQHTIDSSGLNPAYATNATVSANPASPTFIGNWLANSSPSPGAQGGSLPTDGMWLTNGTPTGVITFDLGSIQTLAGIWVWNYSERDPGDLSNRGAKGVDVYAASSLNASLPGGGDTYVQSFTFARQAGPLPAGDTAETYLWAPEYYQFSSPLTAEYIKLNILGDYGGNGASYMGLAEVKFQTAPVPEPSAFLLAALGGIVGLGFFSRRQRAGSR